MLRGPWHLSLSGRAWSLLLGSSARVFQHLDLSFVDGGPKHGQGAHQTVAAPIQALQIHLLQGVGPGNPEQKSHPRTHYSVPTTLAV